MLTKEELRNVLAEAGLGRIAKEIAAQCEPCVLVQTLAHPYENFHVGGSRIGGVPDLPAGVEWPTWHEEPLSFLAQFNLRELQRFGCCGIMPSEGHLWFFYAAAEQRSWGFDPNDRGSWRVIYAPTAGSGLLRREAPELPDHGRYKPCLLKFHDFLSMRGPESLSVVRILLTLDEIEQLDDIDKALHEMADSEPVDHGLSRIIN